MKIINIFADNTYSSSDLDGLFEIDLNSDVVICTPSLDKENPFEEVEFNGYGFSLYNFFTVRLNKDYNFDYFCRLKMSIPRGLKFTPQCTIPGLYCIQNSFEITPGIEIKNTHPIETISDLVFYANGVDYNFYNKLNFILKDYNKEIFIKHANKVFNNNIQIPPKTNIMNIDFVQTFIGNKNSSYYNEIYLIHSDYIYNNFPNFGGNK